MTIAASDTPETRPVKRRIVFYIPGFDPHPARRYRELYRTESVKQAAISGYTITQAKMGQDAFGWRVAARIDGQQVISDINVLVWSDIVRKSMGAGIVSTYLQLLRTAWIYISSGALRRLSHLRKGPLIAALYPPILLLLQLAACLIAARIAAGFTSAILGIMADFAAALLPGGVAAHPIWPGIGTGLAGLVFVAVTAFGLRWFRALDGKIFAYYLMHDYAFTAKLKGATPPELQDRMNSFAARIERALKTGADEVLVIGHSSGAHLAISILADLLRKGAVPKTGPALSLMSLGQVVPMVSFLPKAHALRRDLRDLSRSDRLTWVDVSAPGDGCSFALCDPVAVSGVAPVEQRWPLVLSAAFSQTLKPETFRKLKRRYFRLHFQYLCAFDNPDTYDYFQITAGPKTLADRFAGRVSSANRIDVPASPHRSMVA